MPADFTFSGITVAPGRQTWWFTYTWPPGGKDPDFWCAFEDGEVEVIGDEPGNTGKDPDPSEKALS
jgi:hypothetical protein